MKAELYMISPEQEFSLSSVQEGFNKETADASQASTTRDQWLRLWERNWIRLWDRNWIRLWERNWMNFWDRNWMNFWDRNWINWQPPWEVDRILKGDKPDKIEPIIERLLLRREKEGFLAMDSLTSRILKLDEQAGKLVQMVQDGKSPEAAAKQLNAKKEELEEFLSFLKQHDISTER